MHGEEAWPASAGALAALQEALAAEVPPSWRPPPGPFLAAGLAFVSGRGARGSGAAGDPGFAGAVLLELGAAAAPREIAAVAKRGPSPAPYAAGHLALREGPLLAAAARALPQRPDVLLVHAAGRDHPRRAGLALMLGAALDLPSVGVTARPLAATGEPPPPGDVGIRSPLVLAGEVVGYWICTRAGVRPVVAHAGWRTSPETAVELTLRASSGFRQPEPIRRALEIARSARSRAVQ